MEIRISGLTDGEYPFDFTVTAEQLELASFEGEIKVVGTLRKVSTQFFIMSTVVGTLVGECDRCLAQIRRRVDVPMNIYYTVDLGEEEMVEEGGDTEMRIIHPEQDLIVLDDEVRQTLTVEVPLKLLCDDACKGICPSCGIDRNREECNCGEVEIDPRWAKLADVFKKKDEE